MQSVVRILVEDLETREGFADTLKRKASVGNSTVV